VDAIALETEVSADARTCASAEVLRAKIAERLGRDPFTTNANANEGTRKIRVSFARDKARAWTADIALLDAAGNPSGGRTLADKGATCEPLATSVVFTIAVLLEDLAPATKPADPAPAPPPPASPPLIEEGKEKPAPPPPATSGRTVRLDASIGPTGALGTAPAPAGGGELGIGVDVSRFRIEVAGRAYLPSSSDDAVAVRTSTIVGRVAPCYGWTAFAACAVGTIGTVSGEATGEGVASSKLESQLYAAAGLGVVSRLFVVDDLLFVRANVDALFSITRTGFDVGDRRVWTVPVFAAAGTIALGARLP